MWHCRYNLAVVEMEEGRFKFIRTPVWCYRYDLAVVKWSRASSFVRTPVWCYRYDLAVVEVEQGKFIC